MARRDRFVPPDPGGGELGAVSYRPEAADDAARAEAEAALADIEGVRGIGEGRDRTGEPAWICSVVDRAAAARPPSAIAGRTVLAEITGEIDARRP